jgi:mannose-6-phosphate isomerase-like protein (cupin superfamily)
MKRLWAKHANVKPTDDSQGCNSCKLYTHQYRDEITYCIKGLAVMNVSGKEFVMKAGDLMYIPALMPHES